MKNQIRKVLKTIALAVVPILLGGSLVYSAQCSGITKKGAQCKRQAAIGSVYCWQHGGNTSKVSIENTSTKNGVKSRANDTAKKLDDKSTRCLAITN